LHAAGYNEAQIRDIELKSAELNKRYPHIGMDQAMSMYRVAGTIVDPKDVNAAMEPLSKYVTLLMAQDKSVTPISALDTLRGIDLRGGTDSVAELTKNLEIAAKTIGAFSGSVTAQGSVQFAKRARSAAPGLSDRFIGGVYPSLSQKMGDSEAGTAVAAFHRAIVGGTMDDAALKEFTRLGLVDPNDLERSKKRSVTAGVEYKGLKPGKGLKGRELAYTDQDLWVQQYLLPALKKKGITSPEKIQQSLTVLFSKGTAEQLAGIYATQEPSIARDRASYTKAPGLGEADYVMAHNAQIQMTAATTQARDVLTTFTSNIYGTGGALQGLGAKFAAVNEDLAKHKDGASQTAGELSVLGIAAVGLGAIFRTIGLPLLSRAFMSSGAGLAAYGAYQVLKPTPANAQDNEFARQKLYTPEFRSLSPMEKLRPDMSPARLGPGMLSPQPSTPAIAELKGEADVRVKVEVAPSSDFVLKVEESVAARGNMRADRGVSMSPQ
jgi:hypothetical protein